MYCAIVTKKNSIFNFPPLIFHRHQDNLRLHHKMLSSLCRLESFSRKNYCQQIPRKVLNWSKSTMELDFFCLCTLLFEMPSNSKGKNFVWKIYWNFPLNMRVSPATDSDGSTCRFWWKYLQKVNAKRLQISDEK